MRDNARGTEGFNFAQGVEKAAVIDLKRSAKSLAENCAAVKLPRWRARKAAFARPRPRSADPRSAHAGHVEAEAPMLAHKI